VKIVLEYFTNPAYQLIGDKIPISFTRLLVS
jgi:hypothetical protein